MRHKEYAYPTLTQRRLLRMERARKNGLLRGTLSGPVRRPGLLRRLARAVVDTIKLFVDIRGRNGLT